MGCGVRLPSAVPPVSVCAHHPDGAQQEGAQLRPYGLKRAAVASTMKGVCIFMPVRDESESDSDSESESESEDESSDEVMPAKRARGPPKSHA